LARKDFLGQQHSRRRKKNTKMGKKAKMIFSNIIYKHLVLNIKLILGVRQIRDNLALVVDCLDDFGKSFDLLRLGYFICKMDFMR